MRKSLLMMIMLVLTMSFAISVNASSVYEAEPGFLGGKDLIKIQSVAEFNEFYNMGIDGQLDYIGVNVVSLEDVRYQDIEEYEQLYSDVTTGEVSAGEADLNFVGNSTVDGSEQINRLRVIYKGDESSGEIEQVEAGFFGGEPEITFFSKDEFKYFYNLDINEQLTFIRTDVVGLDEVEYLDESEYQSLYDDVQSGEVYEGEATLTYVGNSIYDGSEKTRDLNVIYRGEPDTPEENIAGFMSGRDEIKVSTVAEFNDIGHMAIEEQLEYLGINVIGLENVRYGNLDQYQELAAQVASGEISEGEATITFVGNSIYDGSEKTREVKLVFQLQE